MKNEDSKKTKKSGRGKIIGACVGLSVIVGIALTAGFGFGYVSPHLLKPLRIDNSYSTWMSTIKDDAKLVDIAIPGSHDAGSKGMMAQAMTQGHDIKDQLKGGVRYFDTRVTNSGSKLVIFHGPIKGQPFQKVIKEFANFITENPSEFVIIDFQHLGDGVNQSVIDMVKQEMPMEKMLKSSLFPQISTISMKTLRENNFNFMVTWNNQDEANANDFYYRDGSLRSEYDGDIHKTSDEALITKFGDYYNNAEADKLFVLQAQRTCKTYLGKPSVYEMAFQPKVNEYISNIENDPVLLDKTNIVMRDFVVSDMTNIDLILNLNNAKGIVKNANL